MSNSSFPLIAVLIPFFTAFIIGFIRDKYLVLKKVLVILVTVASLVFVVLLIKPIFIDNEILTYWFGNWGMIDGWVVGIGLEVDALSIFVGLIITVACLLSAIYAIKYMSKDNGLGKYYTLFLLLTASMIGFVFTGDLFNMYVMLEIMTFAAIALTAFRTEKYKSLEAGFKYLVIGSLGSSLILLGTALIYKETHTLNIAQLSFIFNRGEELNTTSIIALALMLTGYAVKSFMVPCHTWPPDAHMSAPSSISMLLSGVMSKTGVYGLIRLLFMVFGLSSNKALAYLIVFWGALTMIVGVSMALLQSDFKRLLAFHSVSQLGYVITGVGIGLVDYNGVSNLGLTAGLYHMLNHATFKCLLFLCAGAVLYRTGTTDLSKISGLGKKMPFTMIMFLIAAASISGLPPFNGFASKWLIYQSSFDAGMPIIAIVALVVSAMTLASFIKVIHCAFFGPVYTDEKEIKEVPFSMKLPMGILAALCVVFGLFSGTVIKEILLPVVSSIRNLASYINVMIGSGEYIDFGKISIAIKGSYNPEMFLILFFIICIGILISVWSIIKGIGFSKPSVSKGLVDSKYDVFTGGEKDEEIKVGPHDLFWGLKFQFKGYFSRLSKAHSGVVNDYALWVVATLAVITLYCLMMV